MKTTGIVRRVDDLGRVVIPKEIRRSVGITEGDPVEFFLNQENGIVIERYNPTNMVNFSAFDTFLNDVQDKITNEQMGDWLYYSRGMKRIMKELEETE